jgi:hypothetical protein
MLRKALIRAGKVVEPVVREPQVRSNYKFIQPEGYAKWRLKLVGVFLKKVELVLTK